MVRPSFTIDPQAPIPAPTAGYVGSFVLSNQGQPPSGEGTLWQVELYFAAGSTVTWDPQGDSYVVIDAPPALINGDQGGVSTPLTLLGLAIDADPTRGDPPAIVPSSPE